MEVWGKAQHDMPAGQPLGAPAKLRLWIYGQGGRGLVVLVVTEQEVATCMLKVSERVDLCMLPHDDGQGRGKVDGDVTYVPAA